MIKHVGRHNNRKVVIVYRQLPNEDHMALITYSDVLPRLVHDELMKCVEGVVAQNTKDVADVLFRTLMANGESILASLHTNGWMKKVPTNQVIVTPTANATVSLGSPTRWFTNVYGKSMQAQYADLAERFEADEYMPAGTVVELGGEKEITRAKLELTDEVFGVISTQAAYLMNGATPGLPVALRGRVPVKVTGSIKKGQRLVAGNDGTAVAAVPHANDVFGIALESSNDTGVKTVEVLVL